MLRAAIVAVPLVASVAMGEAQASALIVDRGLPTSNLNNAAGANRSNVGWDFQGYGYFAGDDFTISGSGTHHVDHIRFWINTDSGGAASANNNASLLDDPAYGLSDTYTSIGFYLGDAADSYVPLVASGNFTSGNATDNANISIARVLYDNGSEYDYQGSSGSYAQLFQVDISNLDLWLEGGVSYQFGAECRGAGDTDGGTTSVFSDDTYHLCFMHASNAALSGSPQDGADDLYRAFYVDDLSGPAEYAGSVDSNGFGWDKSSDVNVQVWESVSEPATLGIFAVGLAGFGFVRRRRAA